MAEHRYFGNRCVAILNCRGKWKYTLEKWMWPKYKRYRNVITARLSHEHCKPEVQNTTMIPVTNTSLSVNQFLFVSFLVTTKHGCIVSFARQLTWWNPWRDMPATYFHLKMSFCRPFVKMRQLAIMLRCRALDNFVAFFMVGATMSRLEFHTAGTFHALAPSNNGS